MSKTVKRVIAENIKAARLAANMTQAEAADKLGITAQAVSNFERGINGIENSLLIRMCKIYAVKIGAVLGEEDGANKTKGERPMAQMNLTDEQVEQEISRLQQSPYVKLANKERRIRTKRRQYLYGLRQLEKKGKELASSGFTMENLDDLLELPVLSEEI